MLGLGRGLDRRGLELGLCLFLHGCILALLGIAVGDTPASRAIIVPFLTHERRGLRRAALSALESFRDPALIPHLEQAARGDEDFECRLVALGMLDGLGAEGVATAAALREEQRALPDAGDGVCLTRLDAPDPEP